MFKLLNCLTYDWSHWNVRNSRVVAICSELNQETNIKTFHLELAEAAGVLLIDGRLVWAVEGVDEVAPGMYLRPEDRWFIDNRPETTIANTWCK